MSTTKKTAVQSPNFWTNIATVLAALFAFFKLTPDASVAADIANSAHQAVDAISTRNWIVLFTVLVNVGNVVWHLFVKPKIAAA